MILRDLVLDLEKRVIRLEEQLSLPPKDQATDAPNWCVCGHRKFAHIPFRPLYQPNLEWGKCSYTQCSCTEYREAT